MVCATEIDNMCIQSARQVGKLALDSPQVRSFRYRAAFLHIALQKMPVCGQPPRHKAYLNLSGLEPPVHGGAVQSQFILATLH